MKNIFLFLLTVLPFFSKAQNTGIGTVSPAYPLTVSMPSPGTALITGATVFAANSFSGNFNSCGVYGSSASPYGFNSINGASGVLGEITSTVGGGYSAGLRGINRSTDSYGIGVVGYQAGSGTGIYGETISGTGVYGTSSSGTGGIFFSATGPALSANSYSSVSVIQATNTNAGNTGVIYASGNSTASGTVTSAASGIVGELTNTSGGVYSAGVRGINRSIGIYGIGVAGYHAGGGYGVYGETVSGLGVVGYSASGTGGYFSSGSGAGLTTASGGTGPTFSSSNTNPSSTSGAIYGTSSSTIAGTSTTGASAIVGELTQTSGGVSSAAVRGINRSTTGNGSGVIGYHAGSGYGVYGESQSGTAIFASTPSGIAISGTSGGSGSALSITNTNVSSSGGAIYGAANSTLGSSQTGGASGVVGELTATSNNTFSAGVRGINRSTGAGMGVIGFEAGSGFGVYGETPSGDGVAGYSGSNHGVSGNTNTGIGGYFTSSTGTGLVAATFTSGDIAVFKANTTNVARIDRAGKGWFNGGAVTGGADLAEAFAVEGNRNQYEPGDVLVVSTTTNRTVAKSNTAYSTLVIGVYATKPGVLLTERTGDQTGADLVPMGVVGVIPTKVCSENGAIHRGDMLVTSSLPGRAMKASPDQIKFGTVIGKALEDFTTEGNGLIKVLVNVK